jgi:hypothetical protein
MKVLFFLAIALAIYFTYEIGRNMEHAQGVFQSRADIITKAIGE